MTKTSRANKPTSDSSESDSTWRYTVSDIVKSVISSSELASVALRYELDRLTLGRSHLLGEPIKRRQSCQGWEWNAMLGDDCFPNKCFLDLGKKSIKRITAHLDGATIRGVRLKDEAFQEGITEDNEKKITDEFISGVRKNHPRVPLIVAAAYDYDSLGKSSGQPYFTTALPSRKAGWAKRFAKLSSNQQDLIILEVCRQPGSLDALLHAGCGRLLGPNWNKGLSLEKIRAFEVDLLDPEELCDPVAVKLEREQGRLRENRFQTIAGFICADLVLDLSLSRAEIMKQFELELERLLSHRLASQGLDSDRVGEGITRPSTLDRLKDLALVRIREKHSDVREADECLWKQRKGLKLDGLNDVYSDSVWSKAKTKIMSLLTDSRSE
jgi:hypothetical protein